LVMGLTFKEDVPDLRNSKVADVIARLKVLGHRVDVTDPHADRSEAAHEYSIELLVDADKAAYDAVLLAVAHAEYRAAGVAGATCFLRGGGVLADLKGLFSGQPLPEKVTYWSI
jgi:UDP-N-acetyl-D-galactosamine dehydrogenase